MPEENKAVARRFFVEAWNQRRLEALDEIVAPDAVQHDPQDPFPDARGPQAARQLVSLYQSAFPDTAMTIDAQAAEGDLVTTRWTARGTHRGELMGLAPTGRSVTVTGITIDRIADGRIAESWTNWDTLGLMQQIGASPARGSIGEKVGIQTQRLLARWQRRKGGVG
jgi:steroid delta-isomerase-like uncharacterized protein